MNEMSKPIVFLSYTDDGRAEADEIKIQLESNLDVKVWEWRNEILIGSPLVATYSEAVAKSDFMVSVLSPNYWSKEGTKRENHIANQREQDLKSAYNEDYHFLLPYHGEWDIPKSADKSYKMSARTVNSLIKSIRSQLSPAVLSRSMHSFSNWPAPFVDETGNVDCLIVIGHGEKQDEIEDDDLGVLGKYINLEDEAGPQSHRPAEFIPNIVRYLYQKANDIRGAEKLDIGYRNSNFIECHIDTLLIKHRQESIKEHNIITLGAGDTNYISRWVLEYYKDNLPIYYRNTSASERITMRSNKSEKDKSIHESNLGEDRYSGLIAIVPNPLNTDKSIVVAAGLNALATQACMLALSDIDELIKDRNRTGENIAYLVSGIENNWRASDYVLVKQY